MDVAASRSTKVVCRDWWARTVRTTLDLCGRKYSTDEFDRYFRRVYQFYGRSGGADTRKIRGARIPQVLRFEFDRGDHTLHLSPPAVHTPSNWRPRPFPAARQHGGVRGAARRRGFPAVGGAPLRRRRDLQHPHTHRRDGPPPPPPPACPPAIRARRRRHFRPPHKALVLACRNWCRWVTVRPGECRLGSLAREPAFSVGEGSGRADRARPHASPPALRPALRRERGGGEGSARGCVGRWGCAGP